ncbi:unnamed protein product [marine sediment metagenome]|uniref:Uncharacterized protein n=1 Tax=marine sediment metagenome TaxID=412755 RepID=X0TE09_9ZZZZ
MGGTKQLADEVAAKMGIPDPNDSRVEAEVNRLLLLYEKRFVVLETHPNSGGTRVGKLGYGSEILAYLREMQEEGSLNYVGSIVELRENAYEETLEWLEYEHAEWTDVRSHVLFKAPDGTPPLPGLEKRLAGIEVSAYGSSYKVQSILHIMSDEEIETVFADLLESMLQGRPICQR